MVSLGEKEGQRGATHGLWESEVKDYLLAGAREYTRTGRQRVVKRRWVRLLFGFRFHIFGKVHNRANGLCFSASIPPQHNPAHSKSILQLWQHLRR